LVRIARFRYAVVHHPDDSSDLALQVAYQLACADARAIAASVDDHDLDVELIAAKTKEAQELLRRVSQVKRGLTSAQSGLDSARAALDDMKSRISSTLEEISTLVQGDT
jgi:multidrug resistance efflux pump